jgi:hypothetical protein
MTWSMTPSQSLSTSSQDSTAAGLMAASVSSQSLASAVCAALGASQERVRSVGSP